MLTRQDAENGGNFFIWIKALAVGVACGITAALIMISASAAILTVRDVPYSAISTVTVIISALSGAVCGIVTGRLLRSRGLLFGAVSGLIMFVLVYLAGLPFESAFSPSVLLRAVLMTLLGAFGGIAGVNFRHRRRKK